jgi:enoyl-CoA hydratase
VSEPLVIVEKQGKIFTLTLNNQAQRNALSYELVDELAAAYEDIKADRDVLAVIITGAGKGFSSGADLRAMLPPAESGAEKVSAAKVSDVIRDYYHKNLSIRDLPVYTIAAINGAAVGAGCTLALACDMRIAADDAKLVMGFIRIGLHPGMATTYLLPRLVGEAKALELLATAEPVSGKEAERIGLVNKSVPAEDLMEEARKLANKIASGPAVPLRRLKEAIRGSAGRDIPQTLEFEIAAQDECWATEDLKEGITAMLERRDPVFQGK